MQFLENTFSSVIESHLPQEKDQDQEILLTFITFFLKNLANILISWKTVKLQSVAFEALFSSLKNKFSVDLKK